MGTSRNSIVRGTRLGRQVPRKPVREELPPPEEVSDPTRPRHVVDYRMQRRAALRAMWRSGLHGDDCDADPMLLRTARWHGEATDRDCPVCRRQNPVCRRQKLTHLTYTFGVEMGETSGRVRATGELPELAHEYGVFRVYVVEVCERCHWNHMLFSYVLGNGIPRGRNTRERSRAVLGHDTGQPGGRERGKTN